MKVCKFVLIFSVVFLINCDKSKTVLNSLDIEHKKSILGSWDWISSTFYYTQSGQPYIITPETEGYHTTYIFLENDTVNIFRNDTLETSAFYKIDVIKYTNGTTSDSMLFINNFTPANFNIKKDTLTISTTFVDGPEKLFKRK